MLRGNRQAGFRTVRPLASPPLPAATLETLWRQIGEVERGFTTIDHLRQPPPEDTAFALWEEPEGLAVLVRASIVATGGVRPSPSEADNEEIALADSLEIMLDAGHDHMSYLWLHYEAGGVRRGVRRQVSEATLRCDHGEKDEALPDSAWSLRSEVTADAWFSLVRIPSALTDSLSKGNRAAWGFNVAQRRWIGRQLVESAWNPVATRSHTPWDFGEVLLQRSNLAVRDLDFGEVYNGWNRLRVRVENTGATAAQARARVVARSCVHESRAAAPLSIEPGEERWTELRFELDTREWRLQEIAFELEEAGKTVYAARYAAAHSTRHSGGCIVAKHGARWFEGAKPRNPRPDDPDFTVKKRSYILAKLPDFPEAGFWGGPQRDWILRDRRSPLTVNLLSDRVLEDLGEIIAERFATDDERVAAATMLIHRLMIYSGTGCQFAKYLGPLGTLRHGATICSGFTCALNGLLAAVPRVDGGRGYPSVYTGAHNHTIISVDLPHGRTIVDPTLGAFHYNASNTRLATTEELRADPGLSARSILGREKDYEDAPHMLQWYTSLAYPPQTPSGEAALSV